jgi:hypothetical protein
LNRSYPIYRLCAQATVWTSADVIGPPPHANYNLSFRADVLLDGDPWGVGTWRNRPSFARQLTLCR